MLPNRPIEGGEWRREVATRVTRYRARRRRGAASSSLRAPSLSLDFEAAAPAEIAAPQVDSNLIEFPRTVDPVEVPQELAEAVVSPPRIFEAEAEAEVSPEAPRELQDTVPCGESPEFEYAEAPELENDVESYEPAEELPRAESSPADDVLPPIIYADLGTILQETLPAEEKASSEPAGMDVSVSLASPSLRVLAGLVDSAVVLTGVALFILLLEKMNSLPVGSLGLLVAAGVSGFLWTLYQYLFLVYRGSTAGLGVAKLTLATMQGSAALRSARRTRALCMLLSCGSLGLGFAWAFLDEDGLCWHDRISQTCLVIASSDSN